MAADEPLQLELREGIAWWFLNRPACRNALDERAVDAIDRALTAAEADERVKAIVIAGRGPSFCAGADLELLLEVAESGRSPLEFMGRISSTFTRLATSRVPVVAAIHGHAVAGGLELALAADVVVAAQGTLIGDGHIVNQLVPAGGSSVRLRQKVGDGVARWLLLTGRLMPAEALTATGWLHAVVPADELHPAAQEVAAQLGDRQGPATERLKRLLFETEGAAAADALKAELDAFAEHWRSTDVAGALRAFFGR